MAIFTRHFYIPSRERRADQSAVPAGRPRQSETSDHRAKLGSIPRLLMILVGRVVFQVREAAREAAREDPKVTLRFPLWTLD